MNGQSPATFAAVMSAGCGRVRSRGRRTGCPNGAIQRQRAEPPRDHRPAALVRPAAPWIPASMKRARYRPAGEPPPRPRAATTVGSRSIPNTESDAIACMRRLLKAASSASGPRPPRVGGTEPLVLHVGSSAGRGGPASPPHHRPVPVAWGLPAMPRRPTAVEVVVSAAGCALPAACRRAGRPRRIRRRSIRSRRRAPRARPRARP